MKDLEVMNIHTGELLSATEAIRVFYEKEGHGALEAWTDEWKFTGKETDEEIEMPDFANIF